MTNLKPAIILNLQARNTHVENVEQTLTKQRLGSLF